MAHHLIPEKTWNNNSDFFDQIGLSGQRDAASNGLLMSDSEASAKLHGNKLYHSSRHREYTNMVIGKLNHIKKRFDDGKISQEEAVMHVKALQRSLRKKIRKGKIKTKTYNGRLE